MFLNIWYDTTSHENARPWTRCTELRPPILNIILQPILEEEVINSLKSSNNFRLITLTIFTTILYITKLYSCRKRIIYSIIWKQMLHLNYYIFFFISFCHTLSYFRSFSSTFRVQKAGQMHSIFLDAAAHTLNFPADMQC